MRIENRAEERNDPLNNIRNKLNEVIFLELYKNKIIARKVDKEVISSRAIKIIRENRNKVKRAQNQIKYESEKELANKLKE